MSIASRIESIEGHIEQAYDELQGLGADLTNVNKNIENISMVLDDIYDSMPQVSGEGTSLTLDDTRVGKIKSTLKGNTSQTGTPTPSSPIPVNVVSGDNEINVCGKNLFSGEVYQANAVIQNNGTTNYNVNQDVYETIVNSNETYTISITSTDTSNTRDCRIVAFTSDGTYIQAITTFNVPTNTKVDKTFTTPNGTGLIRYHVQKNSTNVMLENGSSASTYEPYQGNTYNIDLPVENLFDKDKTKDNYYYNSSGGTTTDGTNKFINQEMPFSNQYTISWGNKINADGNISYVRVVEYNSSNVFVKRTLISTNNTTITMGNTTTKVIMSVDAGPNAYFEELQIEKGSKANSYTPYGTTPLELCKIGNYQDYFGKSDGTNLFDLETYPFVEKVAYPNGEQQWWSGYSGILKYFPVEANTTYTFSNDLNQPLSYGLVYYDENKQVLSYTNATTRTFTTPDNCKFIRFAIGSATTLKWVQIEKGSSATNPQPYGVGKWYKYGAVGKIVFTGASSESYGVNANWDAQATNILHTFTNDVRNTWKIGQSGFLSNKFICTIESGRDFAQEMITCHTTNETPYFFISYDRLSDVSSSSTVEQKVNAFKQWLSSNNVTLYYILATPTITELTYQPLIDQLNLLEKAMSKDGQTNISQVNNDLPFIISASALKEWQENTSLNSTLSMVNPLSLGNTLNTQEIENNTQPIEVDNIEPLEEEENEES